MFLNKVNQKGYTIISLLLSLTILMIITPLIVQFVKLTIPLQSPYNISDLELRQFHFFLESEINQSEQIQFEQNKIHLYKHDGTKITFEKYNNLLRRRVNDTGHEVILRNINLFEIKAYSNNIFTIKCVRGDGHEHEKTYFHNLSIL